MAQPRSLDPCTLKATLKSTINEFHRAELSVDPRPSSLYRLRRIMPPASPGKSRRSSIMKVKCAETIIVQPRGYLIEPYPARRGPSVKCFVQHPYFVRIFAKLLHKSFWWVYIQGILEIGLEVRYDAIKRLELQMMPAGKSKLQFNCRPCRHGGICINLVVVNTFDRFVTAKAHSALSLSMSNFFKFSISFMIACFHDVPCLGYCQLTNFLHASNDIGSGS